MTVVKNDHCSKKKYVKLIKDILVVIKMIVADIAPNQSNTQCHLKNPITVFGRDKIVYLCCNLNSIKDIKLYSFFDLGAISQTIK